MDYKNSLKYIVILPITFTIILSILILLVSRHFTQEIFSKHIIKEKDEVITQKKRFIKNRVENIIKFSEHISSIFPKDINRQKKEIIKFIKNTQYLDSYIFVFEKKDLNDEKNFPKVLINPNFSKQTIDKKFSKAKKDKQKVLLFKKLLKDLREKNEAFIEYTTYEINGKSLKKISYIQYYKRFNWMIGSGFYINRIKNGLNSRLEKNLKDLNTNTFLFVSISLIIMILMSIILYFAMKYIKDKISQKQTMLKQNNLKNRNAKLKLKKHKDILETLVLIEQNALRNISIEQKVSFMFDKAIDVLNIDRINIFKNNYKDDEVFLSLIYEKAKNCNEIQINNPKLQNIPYTAFNDWDKILLSDKIIELNTKECIGEIKEILKGQNVKSVLMSPIFFNNVWWGFISFDNCEKERKWTKVEKDVIEILSNTFIFTMINNNYQESLKSELSKVSSELVEKDVLLIQNSKMSAMGEMIANIAHQWKQPLNLISSKILNLELKIEKKTLDDKYVKLFIEDLDEILESMDNTIDDFRNFFNPQKEKDIFLLDETYNYAIRMLTNSIYINRIDIKLENNKNLSIQAYKNEFIQILIILISNAIDAITMNNITNGYIQIKDYKENDNIFIEIKDNGGGINKNIIKKIWEPYFTTKDKEKGTGIGLYIVKTIVEKHIKGSISINSSNKETTFIIKIPINE